MAFDKIVDSAKLEADLTTVADSIRAKGGTAEPLAFPEGFKTAIDGIQAGGGGQELADSIIDKSVTEITSNVSMIAEYALRKCESLTTVSFPVATSIGTKSFGNCYKLTTTSFPSVTSISDDAFEYCYELTATDFPAATSIGGSAFRSCSGLITASFPAATSIGRYTFISSNKLVELHLEGPTFCEATGDPLINSACKIYVPASLIEQYKVATNWSQYASQFVAV